MQNNKNVFATINYTEKNQMMVESSAEDWLLLTWIDKFCTVPSRSLQQVPVFEANCTAPCLIVFLKDECWIPVVSYFPVVNLLQTLSG